MAALGCVSSMTGFASVSGGDDRLRWTWELRAVNARGLDVRLRLPSGWDHLEPAARRLLGERLKRGSISAVLQMEGGSGAARYAINRGQLDYYIAAIRSLQEDVDLGVPSADGLLGLKGVIEPVDEDAVDRSRDDEVTATLSAAVDGLFAMRVEEGARIASALRVILDQIGVAVETLVASSSCATGFIRQRLERQLADLLGAVPPLSAERLHQEAALLAVRGDIREEIDRLRSHIVAARELLEEGGPIGRRLDFLAQEFNREANTVCSKAVQQETTTTGLELKARIEQMREQIQNIE